jgi:translation initiation factor RLI1
MTRIAIVNNDKCKPKKCRQECKRNCPVVSQGKLCIEVTSASKVAYISEELCTGCNICTKVSLLVFFKDDCFYFVVIMGLCDDIDVEMSF